MICYSPIDQRHRYTEACNHIVAGQLVGAVSGLAICQPAGEDGFYLFGCDSEWQTVTDTWHPTFDDAKHQAEIEYEGVSKTWIDAA